jgi:hypothetical protein
MTIPLSALRRLLASGEVPAASITALPAGEARGLWAPSRDGTRQVATAALVRLWSALGGDVAEAVAAVCACEDQIRPIWLGVLAARLAEMGQRRDAAELCRAVNALGSASAAVHRHLAASALRPTGLTELETELFGAPAEQAVALPKLLRAVAATAELVEGGQGRPAERLPDILPLDPSRNWVRGRLLRSLDSDEPPPESDETVLSGGWAALSAGERALGIDTDKHETMRWVLLRPWALLLAQVVFTQDAWAAEPLAGGLTLELDDDQLGRFHEPGLVRVTVTTADGEEVLCGSLGELLRRVLTYLGVTVLAPSTSGGWLDDRLGPLVHALLERKVWHYDLRAARGQRPGYLINDSFSSACYRRFGSNYFYRLGTSLYAAVRSASESWARERLRQARTGEAVAGGGGR